MTDDTKALHDLIDAIQLLDKCLLDEELTTSERKSAAVILYPNGTRFVNAVTSALLDEPAIYDDLPVDARKIADLQDRADALLDLRGKLTTLLRRCSDDYLLTHSAALSGSLTALKEVRKDAISNTRTRLRAAHLAKAEELAPRRRTYQPQKRTAAGAINKEPRSRRKPML